MDEPSLASTMRRTPLSQTGGHTSHFMSSTATGTHSGTHLSSVAALVGGETEVARLQKQNFNLKLRIYYLEERLAKGQTGGGDATVSALHDEVYELKVLVEEKTRELEERNLLLVKARNAIESLQADVELARAETERLRSLESSGHHTSEQVSSLTTQVRSLEMQLSEAPNKEAVEATMRVKDAEIHRLETLVSNLKQSHSTEKDVELRDLRQEVVRLSTALGEARGRADTLSQQAQDVAQLEADEIASLQLSMRELRQELDNERSMGQDLAGELELKTNLLAETDSTLKALEDKLAAVETERDHLRDAVESGASSTKSSLRDMELKIQVAKTRELEQSRDIADLTGQVQALKAACRTTEEREADARRQVADADARIRELEGQVAHGAAETELKVAEESVKVQEAQREVKRVEEASRAREAELTQQLQHWEHHLRSTLVEFLAQDDSEYTSSVSFVGVGSGSGSGSGGGVGGGSGIGGISGIGRVGVSATGRSKEADLELLSLLKSLPRIKRWFESSASEFLARASASVETASSRLDAMAGQVASIEDKVRPTLFAASAAISSSQAAERRASEALVTSGSVQHELQSAKATLDAKDQLIEQLQAELTDVRTRCNQIEDNNAALLKELEERRNAMDLALHDKSVLMDDAERLKRQVLERDARLEQYMNQLATRLSGVATGARIPSEASSAVTARLHQLVSDTAALVSEASGATRLLLGSSSTLTSARASDTMASLSTLLHQNEKLSMALQDLAGEVHRMVGGGGGGGIPTTFSSGPSMSGMPTASRGLHPTSSFPSASFPVVTPAPKAPATPWSTASVPRSNGGLGYSQLHQSVHHQQQQSHHHQPPPPSQPHSAVSSRLGVSALHTSTATAQTPVPPPTPAVSGAIDRYGGTTTTASSTAGRFVSSASSYLHQQHQLGGSMSMSAAPAAAPAMTATDSPATSKQRRLEKLQSDMVSRLGRIGSDLSTAATRLSGYTPPVTHR